MAAEDDLRRMPGVRLRSLTPDDAHAYRALCCELDCETHWRLYAPGERPASLDVYRRELSSLCGHRTSCVIAAELETDPKRKGMLIGYIAAYGHTARRMRHCVSVAIGVLQYYNGRGIGTALFNALELWAREECVTRLELTVMKDNETAVGLYKKLGFEIEGVRKGSLSWSLAPDDGLSTDELYMAKILD